MLDAAETLQRFMVNRTPDRTLFEQTLAPIFARCGGVRLRAFGEMVASLWAEGNHHAALRLEALWNDHGLSHHFALLCAYPVQGFGAAGRSRLRLKASALQPSGKILPPASKTPARRARTKCAHSASTKPVVA